MCSSEENMSTACNSYHTELLKLCNDLQTGDKRIRKKTLEEIHKQIFKNEEQNSDLQKVFELIHMPLLKCVGDQSEMCREIAITIVNDFIENLQVNDYYLTYILPTFEKRLGGIIILEESEEVRLRLLCVLHTIIKKYQNECLFPFFDSLVLILTKSVVDPYPKLKQKSCECISDLCTAIPKHFHMQAEQLIKPVMTLLSHQHFRVRVSAVKCISDIVEYGRKLPDDVIMPLACLLGDSQPSVRLAVNKLAHAWLLRFFDRYSYFAKIIPLILLGLTDEVTENVTETEKLWMECGKQYELENENDLKNQMDYLTDPPKHYPLDIKKRPILGCRVLVTRHINTLLNATAFELEDWRDYIRVLSARLLIMLVIHAEDDITQYLHTYLQAATKSCRDKDSIVVEQVEYSSWIVGHFVHPKKYLNLIIPMLVDAVGSVEGHLKVLAALLKGTPKESLVENMNTVCEALQNSDISENNKYGALILNCCKQLMSICEEDCASISYELFHILVTVGAVNTDNNVKEDAETLLKKLSSINDQSITELYSEHNEKLLSTLLLAADIWTVVSPHHCIFEHLLLHSGFSVFKNMDLVMKILYKALNTEVDPKSKISIFMGLSTLFLQVENVDINDDFKNTLCELIKDIVLPNLIWSAGRIAESVRGSAVVCLCSLLPVCAENVPLEMLISPLLGLVEDNSPSSRVLVLRALNELIQAHTGELQADMLNKIYPEVLKRLDDANKEVRVQSIKTLNTAWKSINTENYDSRGIHSAHIDYVNSTLLIHIDDRDENYQECVLDTLKTMSRFDKTALCEKVHSVKSKCRNQVHCEALLQYLSE